MCLVPAYASRPSTALSAYRFQPHVSQLPSRSEKETVEYGLQGPLHVPLGLNKGFPPKEDSSEVCVVRREHDFGSIDAAGAGFALPVHVVPDCRLPPRTTASLAVGVF